PFPARGRIAPAMEDLPAAMNSLTVEKVFGGMTYILEAFSKFDFFSQLQSFLQEVYGPVSFTMLAAGRSPGKVRLEFSTLLEHPPQGEEIEFAPDASLLDVLRPEEGYQPPEGQAAPTLDVRGQKVPVRRVEPICAGGRCFGWLAFHESGNPQ